MRIVEPISTLVSTAVELPTMTSRVDPEGARRMMEMLVNLYADRRLAVVREYVSNAVDATRAAGGSEPVEVSTPSLIEPNFVVTDRGTGMSVAEVEQTFLAFAASSKRESNEMIGGLGVGAKSAWALAESFLVDTVKGGLRTTVRAARNLEHQVLLAGVPSDLPDGTTIIVPVEIGAHGEAWRRAVREVACAHDAGAVLVDGAPVASLAGGPTWIGPVSCRRVDRPDRSAVMVRSGGTLFTSVPEVTQRVTEVTKLPACVIELPIGSFDHTPSRESVIATERTLAAVDGALGQFRVSYDALVQEVSRLAATDVAAAVGLRSATLGRVATAATLPIPFRVGVPAGVGAWHVDTASGRSRWARIEDSRADVFEAGILDPAPPRRGIHVQGPPAGTPIRNGIGNVAAVASGQGGRPQPHRSSHIGGGRPLTPPEPRTSSGTPELAQRPVRTAARVPVAITDSRLGVWSNEPIGQLDHTHHHHSLGDLGHRGEQCAAATSACWAVDTWAGGRRPDSSGTASKAATGRRPPARRPSQATSAHRPTPRLAMCAGSTERWWFVVRQVAGHTRRRRLML
ncbi:ATP-binding protein [Mycobacterium sp. 134]|uniref:ATP-binding protein n=1 Tax=Mycobacterium sp. 134 TaxID=3400425 RepID=UPI003AAC7228